MYELKCDLILVLKWKMYTHIQNKQKVWKNNKTSVYSDVKALCVNEKSN